MTETTTAPRLSNRTRYWGLWVLGGALYWILIVAGYPLIGVGAFAVCAVATGAVAHTSDAVLFDERDREIFRTASNNTVRVLAIGSAIVFPSMVVLEALGYAKWPVWLAYAGYFVIGLWALWFAFLLLAWVRR